MNVLVATDGSKNATAAAEAAGRLLRHDGENTFDLLCVVPKANPRQSVEKSLRHASKILDKIRGRLAGDGISVHASDARAGSAAADLIRAAKSYDITVLGAQSHRNGTPAGMGPVASRVMEHAASSVLLARGERSGDDVRILVPVDGSDRSLHALDTLNRLLDLDNADLTLVHVVETPWLPGEDDTQVQYDAESLADNLDIESDVRMHEEIEREGEQILARAHERLPRNVGVSTMIYRGLPAQEILSEANTGDYDLVVLSTGSDHDLKHQVLGSVSAEVAWNAPCSVLVVRQPE